MPLSFEAPNQSTETRTTGIDLRDENQVVDLTDGQDSPVPQRETKYGELHAGDRIMVFTDGAARGNQFKGADMRVLEHIGEMRTPST